MTANINIGIRVISPPNHPYVLTASGGTFALTGGAAAMTYSPANTTTYPALGSYNIGGSPRNYGSAAALQRFSLEDAVVYNVWNGWEHGGQSPKTMPQVISAVNGTTVRATKFISYFDAITRVHPVSAGNAGFAADTVANAQKWWLYTSYPGGSIVPATYYAAGYSVYNVFPGGTTSGGRTGAQYIADYYSDYLYLGDALGLATDGSDSVNSLVAGSYYDDAFQTLPKTGDWLRTGATSGTNAGISAAGLAVLQRIAGNSNGKLQYANLSQFQNTLANIGSWQGNLDGGVMEGMTGYSWSREHTDANVTLAIQAYQFQVSVCKANAITIFASILSATGTDQDDSTPYRAMRNALAFCLTIGNARFWPNTSTSNSVVSNVTLWYDEFSVNASTAVAQAIGTAGPYMGYLGPAVDPPQTSAFQLGMYRRRYTYGEVWWNPKGNGSRTITFGRTVRFLSGSQAPTINTGGTGTTRAIAARDGLIVLY